MEHIVYCQLISYKDDGNDYITYVFKNLESTNSFDKYVMCTKYPNWQSDPIKLGAIGYLKILKVVAGKDSWFDRNSLEMVRYKYSAIQFIDFIPEKTDINGTVVLI